MSNYPGDVMGSGRTYSHKLNLHSFINDFWLPRYAFTPTQSAVIVGSKQIPDVSFYQGVIDWDKMRAKTDAVIIRAGQNIWVDPQFSPNYKAAKARNMLRGVYWFFDDRKSPREQADLLISLIKDDLPEMEIWADWERTYNGAYSGLANVVAFMQYIEQALPSIKIGCYTGYYWFKDHSNAVTNASQYNYLKTKPLWLAWYTNNASIVLIPKPWDKLLLWQYGTPILGASYGVETAEIDMNIPNLTGAEFYARYGQTSEPPPIGDDMVTLEQWNALLAKLDGIKASIDTVASKITGTPPTDPPVEPPPPATGDGYTGPSLGIYRVLDLPDMQTGNAITTIQDSYGNEITVVMDKMVSWMEANCPGWANFVKNGSVTKGPDGLWRYEVKLIKGQLVRIAEVGGKTKENPLGNGRIVGMDSESIGSRCAVNMDEVSPTKTPYYFHKITGQPWYFPIIQPRQQKQMTVPNSWWVPMKWLEKV